MHALEITNINFERDIVIICCYWGAEQEYESEDQLFLVVILFLSSFMNLKNLPNVLGF